MHRLAFVILILAACGDDSGGGADAGPDVPDAPRGDGGFGAGDESGRITIRERAGMFGSNPYTFAEFVADGLPVWHAETMRSGDCRLLEFEPAFCDPPCLSGLCAPGGVCQPYPTFESAGNITVTGLKTSVTLTPSACGFCGGGEQYYTTTTYPADLFDDDASVTASAAGAAFPAFSVTAGGVPPLAASYPEDKITLVDGQDFTLAWTSAGSDARVRVTINANNQGHGNPYLAIIECDGDDTGSLVIPSAIIDAFPDTMAWAFCAGSDCPPSSIMRYRRGTTTAGGGTVELVIGSEVLFGVDHNPN